MATTLPRCDLVHRSTLVDDVHLALVVPPEAVDATRAVRLAAESAAARAAGNPSVSLDKYIDYHTGTMNSPSLRNVNIKYRDGAGVTQGLTRDLADGRHMRFFNAGLQYEGDFDGWLVSAKGGFTKGKSSFDAFYSTTNPVDGNAFIASNLAAAQTAPGQARRPGRAENPAPRR